MHLQTEQEEEKLKIIIVGDSGVGKTCIRNRFCHNDFEYQHQSTVGIQYSRRKFWAPIDSRSNRLITACFWDAAGKINQNQLLPSFFKNIIAVIYVFDLTKQQSLANIKIWKSLVTDHTNVNRLVEMMIGNKTDLICLREVSMSDAEKVKRDLKIPLYFETSALQNLNINQAFYNFLSQIARQATVGVRRALKIKQKQTLSKCYN